MRIVRRNLLRSAYSELGLVEELFKSGLCAQFDKIELVKHAQDATAHKHRSCAEASTKATLFLGFSQQISPAARALHAQRATAQFFALDNACAVHFYKLDLCAETILWFHVENG